MVFGVRLSGFLNGARPARLTQLPDIVGVAQPSTRVIRSSRTFQHLFFWIRLFVNPCHSRQFTPGRVPDLIFDPVILDSLVGRSIEVDGTARSLEVCLASDPLTLLGYLIQELMIGTRRLRIGDGWDRNGVYWGRSEQCLDNLDGARRLWPFWLAHLGPEYAKAGILLLLWFCP